MTKVSTAVEQGRRRQVLQTLRASDVPLSLQDIAAELQVHPNTVRFHVERLQEAGQVAPAPVAPRGPGRPRTYYQAVPRMDPGGPRQYRMLAEILLDALGTGRGRRDRATAAGHAWGARMATETPDGGASPRQHLLALLDRVGFAPETPDGDPRRIALRHCPFLEIAEHREDVVCPVHLGLMQGALAGWGADDTVTRLDAFVEPDVCMAYLQGRAEQPEG